MSGASTPGAWTPFLVKEAGGGGWGWGGCPLRSALQGQGYRRQPLPHSTLSETREGTVLLTGYLLCARKDMVPYRASRLLTLLMADIHIPCLRHGN
jgi:hypothetical protein